MPDPAERSIAARLDRLPLTRWHWALIVVVGLGSFFDLYEVFLGGEHECGAGLVDGSGPQGPPSFDEFGEFGFDVDVDEAEEVDVLAVAGGDE